MKSVIVGLARTPIGRFGGGLKPLPATGLGLGRHRRRPRERRRTPGRRRRGDLRSRRAGRRGTDHRAPGRHRRRHPHDRPLDDHQQGLPLRPHGHRHGRSLHPPRRVRRHRGRRHGVDEQRPLPPPRRPLGWPPRPRPARRRDAARRPLLRFRRVLDGRVGRPQERSPRHLPRGTGRVVGGEPPARRRRPRQRPLRPRDRVPVDVPARRGQTVQVEHDEGIRDDTTVQSLAGLRPGLHARGHDHGRERLADQRRRRRCRRRQRTRRRRPRHRTDRGGCLLRTGCRPRRHPARAPRRSHPGRARPRRPVRLRPRRRSRSTRPSPLLPSGPRACSTSIRPA